eukprot:TRINITY_DN547_c0_g1_i1.p1 TRINITY_DN547_c0_g1~~TRINITY_DN547_c0_g1_i1.p1  ORF type:complete len:233 (-),score=33.63 TRINITY_DN547_c0_g1_i1:72-770(-)
MSGWVSTVSASSTTSEELSQSVVDDYTVTLADYYGVLEEEINVVTTYEATGSMSVTIPDDVNEEALVDAITDSIATSLGVHPQNVGVTVDMQTGDVEFSVTSNSFNEAAGNQFDLDNEQYQNSIVSSIESTVPSVTVDSYEVANDVTATLEFTVDADAATNDLTQAAWQSEQLLSGFDVSIENAICDRSANTHSICKTNNLSAYRSTFSDWFCRSDRAIQACQRDDSNGGGR